MNGFLTKHKLLTMVTALSLVTLIVGSTFAWSSLSASMVNEWYGPSSSKGPGGSLHDDHNNSGGDSTKDVYVENWGNTPILARIKLSEYMETGPDSSNPGSFTTNYIREANNTSTPLISGTINADNSIKWTPHGPTSDPKDCGKPFHTYWSWDMGGKKFYMPATQQEQDAAKATNSSVLQNTNIFTAASQGAKETLDCTVITMSQYIQLANTNPANAQSQNYWVVDTDGWAYWNHLIMPGQATGLLLHQVKRTNTEIPDKGAYYYAINVQANMADLEGLFNAASRSAAATTVLPNNATNWFTGVGGTEVGTSNAAALFEIIVMEGATNNKLGDGVDAAQVQSVLGNVLAS